MDFNFTQEQNMLRDSIAKLIQQHYDFDTRRKVIRSKAGWRREIWAEMAELGLMMAPLPEEMGGLGGGPIDTLVIMEEFGKGLVIEPFLPSVVASGTLIRLAGNPAQKEEHGGMITTGAGIYALASSEPKSRYNLADVTTTAKKSGSGYVLNGHKAVVVGAPQADHLIVIARTAGGQREKEGLSAFVVAKSAPGVSTKDYPTVDGFMASDVYFENVSLGRDALVGPTDGIYPIVQETQDHVIAALCAEAVGAMRVAHAMTVDYARQRKQFGTSIGSFQVLQHRMVDMFMWSEQAISMAYLAAIRCGEDDALERAKACAAAKTQIGRAGRFIGQNAIQIFGGMGMTEELAIGHYFKRLTMIDTQAGSADWHLKRYVELGVHVKAAA
ncbi:acyl-CoA dehydrogenase family protein [Candidatus Phycosocius spiralis]|uniref:Acyl-CoA dehydrogenase n=1 Tax=Candidatus Phycosocius spiralis TaxID=2815099 RepID=A0ABQ4PYV1_9PROT|nr:acyl-CoA dehydrogenase [Candidatus Phycosocius spiralis]GIU68090.1 acyl-CoA dehydrogenase [Candidatus Phycosocius spiralis]